MFDIGLQEMLVIGVLALLVFGPSKLPELGRMVGRAMREFRRASDEFRSTVETNLHINEVDPLPSTYSTPATTETATTFAETSTAPSSEVPAVESAVLEAAESAEPADAGEPLVAQRGARLFHRRDCSWVRRIAAADRVGFQKVAEARDQGFVTCPVCEPWEPA
jgi:TatA/E family protein of Tat protein translocase